MRTRTWVIVASTVAAAGTPWLLGAQQARSGYLPAGTLDIIQVLPPAPKPTDERGKSDRAIFKATRALLGTPRGALATRDVNFTAPYMASAFSCAVGVTLSAETAPKTMALIARAGVDANTQSGAAKNFFKRLRPFQIDTGPICQPAEELKGSFDYPSGHTTWGWTWALVLAELAPDRATPILARGRAYGESRIVCGVHNASAVEAGRITAASAFAADHGQAAFLADAAAARGELAALRADPATPKPMGCAAEAALVAKPIL